MKDRGGRFRNQSVLYQWLIAYSIALLLLLSSGVFLNYISVQAIREETINSKQYFLMAVNSEVKKMMEQAQQMYNTIYFNRFFISIRNAGEISSDVQYKIYSFISDLRSRNLNSEDLEYMVYYPALDVLISEHGSMDSLTYYNFYVKDALMSYEDYQMLLKNNSKNRYFLMNDGQYQAFCYAGTSSTQNGEVKANIIILLPGERFKNILERYFSYNINAIAVKDSQNGMVLFHNLPSGTVVEDFMKQSHEGNLFEIEDDNSLIVAYSEPIMQNWSCYLFSYASDFWYHSVTLNRFSILIIVIGLFLCVLGAGIILYRSYRPIVHLMDQVHKILPAEADSRNEYQAFSRALNYIHEDNRQKSQRIQQTQDRLLEEMILRLLYGKMDDQNLDSLCKIFPGDFFVTAAIACENTKAEDKEKMEQILAVFLTDEQDKASVLTVHDRKQLVILKNIEEETKQEQTDQFIWDLSCAVENIRRQYSTECIFCINPEPVAPDRLTTAYKEINKALEYKKAAKVEGIFSDQLLSSFAVRSYYFPLNIEYELSRQIRQGDFENAKKQLEILFQINFSQEPLHLYMTRCLLYDIIGTLVKSLDSQKDSQEIRMLENIDIDLESNSKESIERVQTEIEDVMRVICTNLSQQERKAISVSNAKLEQIDGIKKYVKENLSDLSLSQESIASAFSLSVSYISRLFREVEGISVVDYINHLRMEKVKQALCATNKSIDEISTECGYSGAKTLTRLFKKYEGITPGMWRKIHSRELENENQHEEE